MGDLMLQQFVRQENAINCIMMASKKQRFSVESLSALLGAADCISLRPPASAVAALAPVAGLLPLVKRMQDRANTAAAQGKLAGSPTTACSCLQKSRRRGPSLHMHI